MQFELDNLFGSKRKRIFEHNRYNDKADRRTKCIIHIAASNRELKLSRNAMKKKVQLATNLESKTSLTASEKFFSLGLKIFRFFRFW